MIATAKEPAQKQSIRLRIKRITPSTFHGLADSMRPTYLTDLKRAIAICTTFLRSRPTQAMIGWMIKVAVSSLALILVYGLRGASASHQTDINQTVKTKSAEATHSHTNRLAHEKSPYLLQHQFNPVDWYAWGEEAFEKARRENKPIFLSIGYSTCHWCHVMERESFENDVIARLLNESFVS